MIASHQLQVVRRHPYTLRGNTIASPQLQVVRRHPYTLRGNTIASPQLQVVQIHLYTLRGNTIASPQLQVVQRHPYTLRGNTIASPQLRVVQRHPYTLRWWPSVANTSRVFAVSHKSHNRGPFKKLSLKGWRSLPQKSFKFWIPCKQMTKKITVLLTNSYNAWATWSTANVT